jgi:hypothetical protein
VIKDVSGVELEHVGGQWYKCECGLKVSQRQVCDHVLEHHKNPAEIP